MTLHEMIQFEKEESYDEGIEQGKEQGKEQGNYNDSLMGKLAENRDFEYTFSKRRIIPCK